MTAQQFISLRLRTQELLGKTLQAVLSGPFYEYRSISIGQIGNELCGLKNCVRLLQAVRWKAGRQSRVAQGLAGVSVGDKCA